MKNQIIQTYYRLVDTVSIKKHRSFFETFTMDTRLSGLIGARGTRKTTIMLQYIKEKIDNLHEALYFSADHIYFTNNSLLEFIEEQYIIEGRKYFFIDEIHKYPQWNQELKNIYDSFPDIYVLFSGSSSIDLVSGSYDLSRRAILNHLPGMSFREYLDFVCDIKEDAITLEMLIKEHQNISASLSNIPQLLGYFREYLKSGYYPFSFEDPQRFHQRLLSVIEKTIYEDIASYYSLRTDSLPVLKKMIAFLTTIQPGEVSINSLSKSLRIDNKTTAHYLEILISTGLLRKVGVNKSGAALIRTPDKIFLNNSAMYSALSGELGIESRIGTIRECFFLGMVQNSGMNAFYSKSGDYTIEKYLFEIGGKNKDFRQIAGTPNSFLVKDDILVSTGRREIPLYLFGFLY